MDEQNRFLAAAVILAGFCANKHFANYTEYYLAEMAVSAEQELEKALGHDDKEEDKVSK